MAREPVRVGLGETVELKKPHPCGSHLWSVWRTGIDFGLRCQGCGHRVMIPRREFERALKRVVPSPDPDR